MIQGREFHEIIDNIFDDVKGLHYGEQIQVNCPRCQENEGSFYPDGKFNLEINTAKRVFRCWKCDEPKFAGSLGRLVKTYGTNTDYEVYKSYAKVFNDYNHTEEEVVIEPVKLPEEMIFFSKMDASNPSHFEAYNYMVNERKITREIILKYKLGFCVTGVHGGRIIIPSYDNNGDVNYFVGRRYKQELKSPYMNPKTDKGLFIFNEGMINWDSTVCLVEGAFEMLSFPVNTIPLLGKDLLDALFYKLKEVKPNIIILLDPDAFKACIELFFKVHAIYAGFEERVKIVKLPTKDDLDELRKNRGHDAVLKALYSARDLTVDDYFISKLHKPYGYKGSGRQQTHKEY